MKKLMLNENVGLLLSEDVTGDNIKIIGINHYGVNHRNIINDKDPNYKMSLNYTVKGIIKNQLMVYINESTTKMSLSDILKNTSTINVLDKYFNISDMTQDMLDTAFEKYNKENYHDIKYHDVITRGVLTIIHKDKYSYCRELTEINVNSLKVTPGTLKHLYSMKDFKEFAIIYNCLKSLIEDKKQVEKLKPLVKTIKDIKELFLKAKTVQYYSKRYEKWIKDDYLYLSKVFNTWIKQNSATSIKYARKEIDLSPLY